MSVAKNMQQMKALSPKERDEPMRLIREWASTAALLGGRVIRYATDEQALAAGNLALREHEGVFKRLAE